MNPMNNTQFIDIVWLKTFGIRFENALDYFYNSPFYDSQANNQMLRNQGLGAEHLLKMTGLEFNLDREQSKEPNLFVFNKQYRRSPKEVDVREIFYCIDGVVYRCPKLIEVLKSRLAKVSFYLKRSFDELESARRKDQEPLLLQSRPHALRDGSSSASATSKSEGEKNDVIGIGENGTISASTASTITLPQGISQQQQAVESLDGPKKQQQEEYEKEDEDKQRVNKRRRA